MLPPPPKSTLFPYTTLFRSRAKENPVRRSRGAAPACLTERPHHTHASCAGPRHPICQHTRHAYDGDVPLGRPGRSEEHTSELQSHHDLVCRLLLEKKKKKKL